jgi:hypothetical protein
LIDNTYIIRPPGWSCKAYRCYTFQNRSARALGNLLDSGDGADVTFQVKGVNIAAQKEVTK